MSTDPMRCGVSLSKGIKTTLAASAILAITACGGYQDKSSGGGSAAVMNLTVMSNGFGQLLPHRIQQLDNFGNQLPVIVPVLSQQVLIDYLRLGNPIIPVAKFSEQAVLPTGAAGNHYIYASFTQDIDIDTVLDGSPGAQANSGLAAAVSVTAIDSISGDSAPIQGRVLVGGRTYATNGSGATVLSTWVEAGPGNSPVVVDPRGLGFPGTQSLLGGSLDLVSAKTLIFIPDVDNDLSTHETFPTGLTIRMRITTALAGTNDKELTFQALGATTVGPDLLSPEIITAPPPLNAPSISPGNGDVGVDPLTSLRVEFSEPIQPLSLGPLEGSSAPNTSPSFDMKFGPVTGSTTLPFTQRPVSVYDLTLFEVLPGFHFPGAGPIFQDCSTFSNVDISVNASHIEDLAANPDPQDATLVNSNSNPRSATTVFVTGAGPGLANAPVLPDAIYAWRTGADPGLSVIDLNGFGQGTGNPTHTSGIAREGESKFPFNPNVSQQSGLLPSLQAGTCTIDGGSAGVFTLTLDSTLSDLLVKSPSISNASDLHVGHSLDGVFNNASVTGCQSGGALIGGDVCAADGIKISIAVAGGPNTIAPAAQNQFGGVTAGAENFISWAPHPNPPPLVFPPLCVVPFLNSQEPTTVDHVLGPLPPAGAGRNNNSFRNNLLVPGDPFGNPEGVNPSPPSGLLAGEQNQYFMGPSQGQVLNSACNLYQIRQQVGHFLYVLDRQRREVVVMNSNRMVVIDRIPIADPTSLAMGPNLDFLAVTNQSADTVSFVDIDPASSTFHKIVKETVVGRGPRGIAWQPESEDILVCNELDSSMSLISASSLEVRRVISSQLNRPFEVCVFPRMFGFAFQRGVYFAYVLNRSGTVAIFESGPNGVNGWGFDDILGITPFTFLNPKTIQPDPRNLACGAWVVHEGPLDPVTNTPGSAGEGALSHLYIQSSPNGVVVLGQATLPGARGMEMGIRISVGEDQLSGVPVDVAFDNQRNYGGLPNVLTDFSDTTNSPLPQNSKGMIRVDASTNQLVNVCESGYMFAAIPNSNGGSGVVDVLRIGSAGSSRVDVNPYEPGSQSILSPNTVGLGHYWRQ
ncbi:MAG: hypothetical protein P1V35_13465 [Planctomycetota bacterium]|nr:hypothetical protein [Planctomycetota bacterium]